MVNALHAVALEIRDFSRSDGAATATEHPNVTGARLAQHVHHVLEVFAMAALVGTDRDRIRIFLDRRAHHIRHTAVMPQVDHFSARTLNQAPHHINGRIMAVEQGGRGDKPQWRPGRGGCNR